MDRRYPSGDAPRPSRLGGVAPAGVARVVGRVAAAVLVVAVLALGGWWALHATSADEPSPADARVTEVASVTDRSAPPTPAAATRAASEADASTIDEPEPTPTPTPAPVAAALPAPEDLVDLPVDQGGLFVPPVPTLTDADVRRVFDQLTQAGYRVGEYPSLEALDAVYSTACRCYALYRDWVLDRVSMGERIVSRLPQVLEFRVLEREEGRVGIRVRSMDTGGTTLDAETGEVLYQGGSEPPVWSDLGAAIEGGRWKITEVADTHPSLIPSERPE